MLLHGFNLQLINFKIVCFMECLHNSAVLIKRRLKDSLSFVKIGINSVDEEICIF